MDALPLPEQPVLRDLAERLEAGRHVAEVWDARWRLAYLTSDYLLSVGVSAEEARRGIGEAVYSERTATLRNAWPGGATPESWAATISRLLPAIAHDLPGGVDELRRELAAVLEPALDSLEPRRGESLILDRGDIKFGRRTTTFAIIGARITAGVDDAFAGVALTVVPGLSGSTLSLLATGDHRSLEGLLGIVRPDRRPGAMLFADLEGSTALARSLPAAEYFRVVRRLMTTIDDAIVDRGGLVGKHVGDGASALFLAEQHASESAAVRACIEAARVIRDQTPEIARRSGLEPEDAVVRFGLHWGATLYVGRLLTSGRADVTALGDEMNEAARIEASAAGGRTLASKALIERLDGGDAASLGLDVSALRFTALADLGAATEKARRDAPSIAVCDV